MNESHEFEKECDDHWRKNAEDVVGQNRLFFYRCKDFLF